MSADISLSKFFVHLDTGIHSLDGALPDWDLVRRGNSCFQDRYTLLTLSCIKEMSMDINFESSWNGSDHHSTWSLETHDLYSGSVMGTHTKLTSFLKEIHRFILQWKNPESMIIRTLLANAFDSQNPDLNIRLPPPKDPKFVFRSSPGIVYPKTNDTAYVSQKYSTLHHLILFL